MAALFNFMNKTEIQIQTHWQSIQQRRFKNSTNWPFISGDVISSFCDFHIDGYSIDSENLKFARTVFIKGDFLEHHLMTNSNLLTDKVVVSGNSDKNFKFPPKGYLNLKALLAQNLVTGNEENVFTLPIGIENLSLCGSGHPRYHKKVGNFEIENRVLIPPMGQSNVERKRLFELTGQKNLIFDHFSTRISRRRYFNLTKKYRFILVLEGNGYDTHRLWEVLYQGSFPVVIKSPWIDSLDYLDLPILKVANVKVIDEALLEEFLAIHSNFDPETKEELWAPFWKRKLGELAAAGQRQSSPKDNPGL
jgi:hypothetical protein